MWNQPTPYPYDQQTNYKRSGLVHLTSNVISFSNPYILINHDSDMNFKWIGINTARIRILDSSALQIFTTFRK